MHSFELDATQIAATAKLFSSAIIKEMASKGRSPRFARLVQESKLDNFIDGSNAVRSFFDEAFSILKQKRNRNEYTYKAAITSKLLFGVHSLRTASLLSEFRVGYKKADIAILNGTSTVYEIKSERDKLSRLHSQLEAYLSVFARVNVIAAEKHIDAILEIAPLEVGILTLNDRFKISTIREAETKPERVKPEVIFESIQKSEAFKILTMLNIEPPKVPNTQFHSAMIELFRTLDPKKTHQAMVEVLKESRSSLPLSDFLHLLPKSLQAAALTTPLSSKGHGMLLQAMDTPLREALHWA